MSIVSFAVDFMQMYPALVSFALGLTSQEGLVFVAIFSGTHSLPLWPLLVFGFMGSLFHDSAIYFIWHSFLKEKWGGFFKKSKQKPLIKKLEYLARTNLNLALFISKFLYGARVALVIYTSNHEKSYRNFMRRNAPIEAIALSTLVCAGWLAGRGFTLLLETIQQLRRLSLALLVFLLVFLLVQFVMKRILKRILKAN